jgi:hypothetical protein
MPDEEHGGGWLKDVVTDCPTCPRDSQVGLSYKPGCPPPSPDDRRRAIEEIAADVARREAEESHEEAPPAATEALEPEEQSVTPPNSLEGLPEPEACPTCGRPVVEGAPYDLPAIRKALTDALSAVDALIAGDSREQEALEEMDESA